MSSNNQPYRRAFVRVDRAWDSKTPLIPTIHFGLYAGPSDCYAHLTVRWRPQDGVMTPTLSVDECDWKALDFQRVIYRRMREVCGQHIDPERFEIMLAEAGFKDFTQYQPPADEQYADRELVELEEELEEINAKIARLKGAD